MIYESNYLAHHGIKGQKWGQRRFQNADGTLTAEGKARYGISKAGEVLKNMKVVKKDGYQDDPHSRKPGISLPKKNKNSVLDKLDQIRNDSIKKGPTRGMGLKTNGVYDREDGTKDMKRLQKDAQKDAEDMARAKAYYGEGAGNRRKQIRNRISERMKDPDYKAEYEKHLAAQDMSKHQKAANRERHTQDAKNAAAKVGRGLKNLLLGVGSTSLTAIAIYNAAKMTGADKKIAEFGKKAINSIIDKAKSMKKPSVKDYDWHSGDNDYTVPRSAYTVSENSYRTPSSAYKTSDQTRRDIQERTDRAKHGRTRPYIDKDGNIHLY